MEFKGELDVRDVMIDELAQGKELIKQLQSLLMDASVSMEKRQFLMNQIISIYNKALNLIRFNGEPIVPDPSFSSLFGGVPQNSPFSVAGNSHMSCRSSDVDEEQLRPSKKRKTLPRRVEMVKMNNGEELPGDGYSWRKYGQKFILGAKFRRGYYRCTHRHSQGCAALKQVQRSDEDPTVSQVIYVGDHTCNTTIQITGPSTSTHEPRVHLTLTQHPPQQQPQIPTKPQLTVQTEELNNGDQDKFYFRCFSFSTAVIDSDNADVDVAGWLLDESPVTSGSDQFQASPGKMNTPESDIRQVFTLEELDILDPNFGFDNPDLFI
uniref:WRKY transcription factor n=1 Tax=Fagopyrum tataricum TaxID=62330 RepID=A0A4P9Q266_FAGTA|nr:WRKY transcription factor [Fagopyrum tataricum]